MVNKVLIKLYIPAIDKYYDLFIPVNEVVFKIVTLTFKGCLELNGISSKQNNQYVLLNKITGEIYSMNKIVYDTDIRNGSELVLLIK